MYWVRREIKMLTPVDVQNKVFKGGIGFDKKDVEIFMKELASDYETLYRSNVELKDKVSTLNESLQHYRSIEDSMQKAMTLSEKTAEETVNAANEKSRQLTLEAEKKRNLILEDAKNELLETKNEIYKLKQLFNKFKSQYADILNMQLNILNGDVIDIDLGADFMPNISHEERIQGSGLGESGGYTGNNSFERTNQDSTFANHGSLNMDPFAAAQNGGGRFSKKHTQSYSKNSRKKSDTLDMKNTNNVNEKKTMSVQSTDSTKPEAKQEQKITNTVDEPSSKMNVGENKNNNLDSVSVIREAASTVNTLNESSSVPNNTNQGVIIGEVEDKIKESTMLESEDNLDVGFDFINVDTTDNNPIATSSSTSSSSLEEDTYSGEVEDKIKESTMLESEDDLNEGFDFLVGNEENEDGIPVISNIPTPEPFNIPTPKEELEEGVWEGVVEEGYDPSSLIANTDAEEDDFRFL